MSREQQRRASNMLWIDGQRPRIAIPFRLHGLASLYFYQHYECEQMNVSSVRSELGETQQNVR